MIFNMHIRNDFDKWIEAPKKRVTTLCGKITATKYAGIPGITKGQEVGVWNDGQDVGWCLKCCMEMLQEYDNNDFLYALADSSKNIYNLYNVAIGICETQVIKATSLR